MLLSIGDPVVIPTTRLIRKRSPIVCKPGDQAAHLMGLNLAKELFNFYATKRDISIDESVLESLIRIINDENNFACETPAENEADKYTEAEILDLLFHGTRRYEEMSVAAKEMFLRLRQLLADLLQASVDSNELRLIRDEIEKGEYPLLTNTTTKLSLSSFDDCDDVLDDGKRILTDVLIGMKLEEARLFIKTHRVYHKRRPGYRVTQIQDPRKQQTKDIRVHCGGIVRLHVTIDTNEVITEIHHIG